MLGGVLLLATAVRLVAVGTRLNNDDAYSWWVASAPSPHVFLSRLAASENTPPLFYLVLAPLPIDHPAWLRLPAAIPGVLMCLVLYYALRRALGVGPAVLAALAIAVAPFLITDSDLGRGFMLEDLALLIALWAVLRLGEAESRRWWFVFVVAATVAVYTEYDATIFLLALTLAAIWVARPSRRRLLVAFGVPVAALVPWIAQMVRSQRQVGVTKLNPIHGATSPDGLRDAVVRLVFGENGGTASSSGRWLEFGVIVAIAIAAAIVLRWGRYLRCSNSRRAIIVIATTAALTLVGHAVAGAVGIQIFTERYMTILIPLVAALGAAAVFSVDWRPLLGVASIVLLGVGLVNVIRRWDGEYQPDLAPARTVATAAHPRRILTNTPLVLYYLRSLHPIMDRPYNLGPGLAGSCARPCLLIDDSRVPGGTPRNASGTRTTIGPLVLTLER